MASPSGTGFCSFHDAERTPVGKKVDSLADLLGNPMNLSRRGEEHERLEESEEIDLPMPEAPKSEVIEYDIPAPRPKAPSTPRRYDPNRPRPEWAADLDMCDTCHVWIDRGVGRCNSCKKGAAANA